MEPKFTKMAMKKTTLTKFISNFDKTQILLLVSKLEIFVYGNGCVA